MACSENADAALSNTWSKLYGGSDSDDGSDIVGLSDGYAIVGRTCSYGENSSNVFLVKTDLSGNVRNMWTYGGSQGNTIIVDGDSFIIAGYGPRADPYLLKVYLNGTQAWDKVYPAGGNLNCESITRVGKYYVIAGSDLTNHSIFVIKTRLNGDLVWIKYYGEIGHRLDGNCVIGVTDGGVNSYLITGCDVQSDDRDVYLLRLREDGTVIKKKAIGSANRNETGQSIIAVGSTYYIAGYAWNHSSTGESNAYVLRVNDDLNKMWDHTYGGNEEVYVKDMIKTGDSVIIAGDTGSFGHYPYLARISLDGDLIREYVKNKSQTYTTYSIVSASDGDYVIGGSGFGPSGGATDMFLAKIDSSVLDPLPTPTPAPLSNPTATPTPSGSPTAAPTEEPDFSSTDEPGPGPISYPTAEPTSVPTAGAESSATPVPGAGEIATPVASLASAGDFSTSSMLIIVLLTVFATALAGIGLWLFTQKKK